MRDPKLAHILVPFKKGFKICGGYRFSGFGSVAVYKYKLHNAY